MYLRRPFRDTCKTLLEDEFGVIFGSKIGGFSGAFFFCFLSSDFWSTKNGQNLRKIGAFLANWCFSGAFSKQKPPEKNPVTMRV